MNHITVMKQALDALENIPTSFGNVAYTASVQSAIEALRAAITQGVYEDDLTMAYMAGAASRSEDVARLEEIESEWMRLSQDEGKSELAIERLTTKLEEQLRINQHGRRARVRIAGKSDTA